MEPVQSIEPSAPPPLSATAEPANVTRARRRVAAMKGFYAHFLVFVLVVAGLFAINVATGGSWWVLWVVFGWGIGVVAHAAATLGRTPKVISDWEERKVRQLASER